MVSLVPSGWRQEKDRRRSLTLCGVSAEIQEALEFEDESFYGLGFASETSSDSDTDDESDSDTSGEPLAKRQYSAGIATGVTAAAAHTSSSDDSDDERLSTSTNSSDGESAGAASSPTPAEKKRGLLASDIVDSIRHGCTCKKVNLWMKIPSKSLKIICLTSPRWNVGKRKCLS